MASKPVGDRRSARRESTNVAFRGYDTLRVPRERAAGERQSAFYGSSDPSCRQFVEDVTAYLDGALPESVVAMIDDHLADCPHCREYLNEMRLTVMKTHMLNDDDLEAMPADVRDRLMQAFQKRDE